MKNHDFVFLFHGERNIARCEQKTTLLLEYTGYEPRHYYFSLQCTQISEYRAICVLCPLVVSLGKFVAMCYQRTLCGTNQFNIRTTKLENLEHGIHTPLQQSYSQQVQKYWSCTERGFTYGLSMIAVVSVLHRQCSG